MKTTEIPLDLPLVMVSLYGQDPWPWKILKVYLFL